MAFLVCLPALRFVGWDYRALENELVFTELVVGSVFEVLHAPEASNWTHWPVRADSVVCHVGSCYVLHGFLHRVAVSGTPLPLAPGAPPHTTCGEARKRTIYGHTPIKHKGHPE